MGHTTTARVDTIYIPEDLRCARCKEHYFIELTKRIVNIDRYQNKYRTAPLDKFTDLATHRRHGQRRLSDTATHQLDYMRRHLLVKSCVDRASNGQWQFQSRKVSIRNYTPKAIDQEINMGMWM